MCSRIDMQTHAGRLGLWFDLWPFDLRVSASCMPRSCRGLFYRLWCWYVNPFSFESADSQTDRQTEDTERPTPRRRLYIRRG